MICLQQTELEKFKEKQKEKDAKIANKRLKEAAIIASISAGVASVIYFTYRHFDNKKKIYKTEDGHTFYEEKPKTKILRNK